MSALAQQQEALLNALFAWPAADAVQQLSLHAVGVGNRASRGLQVYQANGHFLAERALLSAYPAIAQILGPESFADLARALWHAHPPHCGDVSLWGAQLAEFMAASDQLQDTPYVADVARAEWALHCCGGAADRDAELGSLALLTTEDPGSLGLRFAPGLDIIASAWPIASLVLAHQGHTLSLAEAGQQVRNKTAQEAVIWRCALQPQIRPALAGEFALLSALRDGMALAPAVDQAEHLDFSTWLPLAVQTGLVLGAYHLSTASQEE